MKRIISILILNYFVFALSSCSEKDNDIQIKSLSSLEQAREFTDKFYNQKFGDIFASFSPEMKELMPITALNDFYLQVINQIGTEQQILSEDIDSITTPYDIYNRTTSFDKYSGPILIRWVLDKEMIIQGFLIRTIDQVAPSNYLEYKTKTNLKLPFNDMWFVFWGGRTANENYHSASANQRFAYDFLKISERKSFSGIGERNEDYYCFSTPILSPGSGTIIATESQIEDNIPGEMNSNQPLGNHVIIDHGNGEFSFMAHLKKETLLVNIGDSVLQGQQIGQCGNSGNSSEPHLHYHMQNSSVFGEGDGQPAQFKDYIANGVEIKSGEPVRGQNIRNID